jgi:ABC-type transport system involved in cytochrome c biogenesis permease subunit
MLQPKAPVWRCRTLLAVVAVAMLAVVAYYVSTVWRARVQTPELVRSARRVGYPGFFGFLEAVSFFDVDASALPKSRLTLRP